MPHRALALLLLLLLSAAAPAVAESAKPLVVEETFLAADIKGQTFKLQALAVKEAGAAGRLPVALITHGQDADPERRENFDPRHLVWIARDFARRGWLGIVVVRRGFGLSAEQAYRPRGCKDGDFAPALDDQTDDLEAAMKAVARRADAEPDRVIALGISVGGAIVLNLAARRPEGLRAVVNISGGMRPRGRDGGPPVACTAEDLVPLFATMGERGRLPSLWLYAENDSLFPGDYVRRLHEAYVARGGRTAFHMFEPIGADGHGMYRLPEGAQRWLPALDRFLRDNHLPTYDPAPIEAAVRELALAPRLRQTVTRYRALPTEKALAISRSNGRLFYAFGAADVEAAATKAAEACESAVKEPCRVLLRNYEVRQEALEGRTGRIP